MFLTHHMPMGVRNARQVVIPLVDALKGVQALQEGHLVHAT